MGWLFYISLVLTVKFSLQVPFKQKIGKIIGILLTVVNLQELHKNQR